MVNLVHNVDTGFDKTLKRMEKIQGVFKNCFAIVVIAPDDCTTWDRLQLDLGCGLLRMFNTSNFSEVPQIIYNYYSVMNNSTKLTQQVEFYKEVLYIIIQW